MYDLDDLVLNKIKTFRIKKKKSVLLLGPCCLQCFKILFNFLAETSRLFFILVALFYHPSPLATSIGALK